MSCARCCADVVRVLCVVFGGDCGFGTFFRVVLCALVLGSLDKVLCMSCALGAFAKKVLCAPCADLFFGGNFHR